jgi:hypothetical protein
VVFAVTAERIDTLPDPLVMAGGTRVTSANMWKRQRRPELLRLYEAHIYGRVPANAPKIKWEVAGTDAHARDGAALLKQVIGRIGSKSGIRRDRRCDPESARAIIARVAADEPT